MKKSSQTSLRRVAEDGRILKNPQKSKHRVLSANIGFSLKPIFLKVMVGEGIYRYIIYIYIYRMTSEEGMAS